LYSTIKSEDTLYKLGELYLISATVTISQWYYLCSMLHIARSSAIPTCICIYAKRSHRRSNFKYIDCSVS